MWHQIELPFYFGGSSIQLQLEQFYAASAPGTAYFDNVILADAPLTSSAVPEPSSMVLLHGAGDYESRSVTVGSSEAARRAGIHAATTAAIPMAATTAT